MKLKKIAYGAAAALAISGMASSAAIASQIKFDQTGLPGGNLSYGGDGGALTASGIGFDNITYTGSVPAGHSNMLTCSGCVLSFMTGDNQSEGPSTWTFDDGGSFILNGTAKNGTDEIASGDLVTGEFTGNPSVTEGGPSSLTFSSFGTDQKAASLLEYFGISPDTDFTFASTAISLNNATFDGDGGFSGTPDNADLNNSPASVPEPTELGIFGLGLALLGLGLFGRRFSGRGKQSLV